MKFQLTLSHYYSSILKESLLEYIDIDTEVSVLCSIDNCVFEFNDIKPGELFRIACNYGVKVQKTKQDEKV